MKESNVRRGARRFTALGASAALAASALAVGLAAPAHAAPVPVTTTVTDAYGNAIDAYVQAYRDNGSGSYLRAEGQHVDSGVMNLPLEPGTYKFEFQAAGYVTEFYSDKATLETADPVAVGGPAALGAVSLAPAAAITGAVTDDQGRPLPHVEVDLYSTDGSNADNYVTTGKDGTFAFAAGAGAYKLRVNSTSVGDKSYVGEYYNNQDSYGTAEVISHGGATTGLAPIALSRGSMIRGRVTGVVDAPLERVRVTAIQTDCSGCGGRSDYTDGAGNYLIEGLSAGSYTVQFSDPAEEYLTEYYLDSADQASATPVVLAKDQLVDVNASLVARAPIDQSTVDLAGRVVDSAGVPVIGASVYAWNTPTERRLVDTVSRVATNRQGYYAFTDLDPASSRSSETSFKVEVNDLGAEKGQFARLSRFYGGVTQYDHAPAATVPAGGVAAGVNVTLPLTGGIRGTVSSESGEPVFRAGVDMQTEDGSFSASAAVDYDGTYETRRLPEGKYKVLFTDYGVSLAAEKFLAHVPEWFSDAITPADAKTIVVKSGQVTSGINAELATSLAAVEKPVISGKQYVGRTVKARPGRWSLNSGTTFTYEWLVGSTVVGSGESIGISKGWQGKKLTLRVTAENGPHSGTALVNSQKLGIEPKIKIKTGNAAAIEVKAKKVKPKKIKGSVLVREVIKVKPNGKIKYKKIGKAKLDNGRANVSLAKVRGKGKHKLVFTFKMKGKIGNAEITKKVKRTR